MLGGVGPRKYQSRSQGINKAGRGLQEKHTQSTQEKETVLHLMLCNKGQGGRGSCVSGLFRAGSLEEVALPLTLKGGWVYSLRRDRGKDCVIQSGPAGLVLQKRTGVLSAQSSALAHLKIPTLYFFLSHLVS